VAIVITWDQQGVMTKMLKGNTSGKKDGDCCTVVKRGLDQSGCITGRNPLIIISAIVFRHQNEYPDAVQNETVSLPFENVVVVN
jgi:hypothetical protein